MHKREFIFFLILLPMSIFAQSTVSLVTQFKDSNKVVVGQTKKWEILLNLDIEKILDPQATETTVNFFESYNYKKIPRAINNEIVKLLTHHDSTVWAANTTIPYEILSTEIMHPYTGESIAKEQPKIVKGLITYYPHWYYSGKKIIDIQASRIHKQICFEKGMKYGWDQWTELKISYSQRIGKNKTLTLKLDEDSSGIISAPCNSDGVKTEIRNYITGNTTYQ